jgi:hypothetical protein
MSNFESVLCVGRSIIFMPKFETGFPCQNFAGPRFNKQSKAERANIEVAAVPEGLDPSSSLPS